MTKATLAETSPDLSQQWHPAENGSLTPKQVTPGSGRKVWWIGQCGHEWQATIVSRSRGTGCPYCTTVGRKRLLVGFNDLDSCDPELASQWHPVLNGDVTPQEVTAKSHSRAWWVCPEDDRHEWEATVKDRAFGYGCPFCTNQRVLAGYNDLATLEPEIVKEWHPTKNGDLTPQEVNRAGKQRIWWLCEVSSRHEWQSTSGDRIKGYGCPYCSGNKVLAGYNDLATTHPEVAAEWHPTKNGKKSVTEVSKGSVTRYWWLCPEGHSFTQIPNSRTHGRGCPYCSNRLLLTGYNDLTTVAPEAAAQWHPEKNKKSPEQVLSGSHSKSWWICGQGHEWKAQIKSRAAGRGCPKCRKPWSVAEKEVYAFMVTELPDTEVRENDRSLFTRGMELDIYIPALKLGIEFNGVYWHDETRPGVLDRHRRKQSICDAQGVRLAIVWEDDWLNRPDSVEETLRQIVKGCQIPGWMTYERP